MKFKQNFLKDLNELWNDDNFEKIIRSNFFKHGSEFHSELIRRKDESIFKWILNSILFLKIFKK